MIEIKKRDVGDIDGRYLLIRGNNWDSKITEEKKFSLDYLTKEEFSVIAGFLDAIFDNFDTIDAASLRDKKNWWNYYILIF